jgi:hypothetical protein
MVGGRVYLSMFLLFDIDRRCIGLGLVIGRRMFAAWSRLVWFGCTISLYPSVRLFGWTMFSLCCLCIIIGGVGGTMYILTPR